MSIEANKKIVCRYFEEAVDQGRADMLEERLRRDELGMLIQLVVIQVAS